MTLLTQALRLSAPSELSGRTKLRLIKAGEYVASRGVVCVAALLLLFAHAQLAQAATFTVTNTNDFGAGSLRQAVDDANAALGADTVQFAVTGTITLTSGQLTVTDDLTLDGPGPSASSLTISGGGAVRVLELSGIATLNVEDLTVASGSVPHVLFGGGIRNSGGFLTVTNSIVSANSAGTSGVGGGIFNSSGSTLTITNSTISENSAFHGAGVYNDGGTVTITNSTFWRNATTFGDGGGVFNTFGLLTVTNSTLVENTAARSGGGLYNTGSGGAPGIALLRNTLIANNTGGNCVAAEPITDGGGNLSWPDATCGGINQDPLLDPVGLQDNGGPTQTIALQPGSPAIDAAVAANCPPTDQRGVSRPQGAGCDIGAFELEISRDILFASTRTGNGDVYVVDPDGGTPTQLTSGNAIDAEPDWSPDRTKIAFTSTRDGNVEIYVMNADGSSVMRLTTHAATDTSPDWSPDGTKIAFASNRGGNWDIYVMDADGGNVARLTTHPAADISPAWSPDGTRIAFSSTRSGGGDIYSMNANGTAQTRLTTASGLDTEPAWSGTTIAFSTNRHGTANFEIYTMNENGSAQTRRTIQAGQDVTPAWSPDGTKLAFATNRTGSFEIFTMNADGSQQTPVTTHPATDVFPDW